MAASLSSARASGPCARPAGGPCATSPHRCGVSAPMLSQVERGETSPTLHVAARIARGLDLRLSQLLRLDEDGAVTIVRARRAPRGRRRRPSLRDPHAAAARPARRGVAPRARAGRRHGRAGRSADARAGRARDRGGGGGRRAAAHRRRRPRLAAGDTVTFDADLSAPLREPRKGGGRPAGRRVGGAAPLMSATTLFEKIWAAHEVGAGSRLHRPPPRPRGDQPAGVRRPPARRPPRPPARPHARHRRPQRPHGRDAGRRPDPRRALARAGGDARAQLRRSSASRSTRIGSRPPGHRPRDRAGAGRHPAGHDDRLRRLATPPPTARSARSPSASARARSSTCWPPRRSPSPSRRACGSATRASSAPA